MQEQDLQMYFQHYPVVKCKRVEGTLDRRLDGKLMKEVIGLNFQPGTAFAACGMYFKLDLNKFTIKFKHQKHNTMNSLPETNV